MPSITALSQSPFRCRLEWGPIGAARAAERGDVVVIVDVLSFSTAVATAVSRGATIYPLPHRHEKSGLSLPTDAVWAMGRGEVPEQGQYSLSPLTLLNVPAGQSIVLPSLNGGTCCELSRNAPHVFIGALVNAEAVAAEVSRIIESSNHSVTVVACGEREQGVDGRDEIRFAIEDYLGAGAIISVLTVDKSPEALVCETAFLQKNEFLADVIWDSVSGRELREIGFEADVSFASQQDALTVCPRLQTRDGALVISI